MSVINKKYVCLIISIITISAAINVQPCSAAITRDEKHIFHDIENQYAEEPVLSALKNVSLEGLLSYAALNNAELKAAFYKWKASIKDISVKRSLDDPELMVKPFLEETETRVGPQRVGLSVSQRFPFPGKLYTKGKMATDVSRQLYADYLKVKLELFYEIKSTFYEYWYLYNSIKITEETKELLKHFEEVAQSKFKAGTSSNQDLLKAQVELGRIANDVLTLKEYQKPIVARFNALLNRMKNEPLAWPEDVRYSNIVLDDNELFLKLKENNPDLEKAHQRVNEIEKKVRLAKLDYLPDFSVGIDYVNVDKGPLNVADNGNDSLALNVKMNVPLWIQKQRGQLDEAHAERNAVIYEQDQIERDLESKLQMILFKVRDAQRQIQLYADALIPKAEQTVQSTEASYKGSRVDFLSLIDSQKQLLNFKLGYVRAIKEYEQSLAELDMIIGEPITREG